MPRSFAGSGGHGKGCRDAGHCCASQNDSAKRAQQQSTPCCCLPAGLFCNMKHRSLAISIVTNRADLGRIVLVRGNMILSVTLLMMARLPSISAQELPVPSIFVIGDST